MRRVLSLPLIGALILLAAARGAGAQQKGRLKPPPAQPAAPTGLRGEITRDPIPMSRAPTASASQTFDINAQSLFLPPPVASAPVGGGGQQCRLACAQQYYFCQSNGQADECPSSWGQCRAGCDAPTLSTSY